MITDKNGNNFIVGDTYTDGEENYILHSVFHTSDWVMVDWFDELLPLQAKSLSHINDVIIEEDDIDLIEEYSFENELFNFLDNYTVKVWDTYLEKKSDRPLNRIIDEDALEWLASDLVEFIAREFMKQQSK